VSTMLLQKKVVVVTGAGAGLGRAVALEAAAAGADVFAVSIRTDELAEVTAQAAQEGCSMRAIVADVGSVQDAERVKTTVIGASGRIDVLINCAGIIIVKPLVDTTVEEWDRLMATNLRGAFLLSKAFVPCMQKQGNGVIMNVSSLAGVRGRSGETAYTASKFGLEGLSRALADELTEFNIRVLTIHPGVLINTPMSMTTYNEEQRARWQDPRIIAPAFVHLAAREDMSDSGKRFDAWEIVQANTEARSEGLPDRQDQEN
jgi:NAD(P)-dependent dehydrogenase (short-subunit alcohol dehydrogenase family)